ncbi:MAG: hypothetical protein C4341_01365 [Armatimonadota bacterium]
MNPGEQITLQPNRLVLEAAHRAEVDCFGSLTGFRLSLRPARRYLFREPPKVRSLQVELCKPAFAALLREDDLEATVEMVIETEPVGPGICALYRAAGIPVVTVKCRLGLRQFVYERDGFCVDLRPSEPLVDRTVHCLVECTEGTSKCGCLLRSDIERVLARSLGQIASEVDCLVHHQVPFGYAVGYRPDLPGRTARQTIELVLAFDLRHSPAGEVVLPVRVETRPVEERDQESVQLDDEVAAFAVAANLPMVAVEAAGGGQYAVTCSMEGIEECMLAEDDAKEWERYFEAACQGALERVCSSLRRPEAQHSG